MKENIYLSGLSEKIRELIIKSYYLEKSDDYRSYVLKKKMFSQESSLFSSLVEEQLAPTISENSLIYASGPAFFEGIKVEDLPKIKSRASKSESVQKNRTKERAEVFTPAWVVNIQNNLIDTAVLYENAFNHEGNKKWSPTSESIKFTKDYTWMHYVTEKRLEMACGEGPYICSREDLSTRVKIPVRDKEGRFARIGLLDRKLRVAYENVTTVNDWRTAAYYACRSTYGYEWQGDNLVLARLNFINTYKEYLENLWQTSPTEDEIIRIAEVASWNLWQMDGLKMVVPESCSSACPGCEKKTRGGHDGMLSIIRMGETLKSFESLGPADWFPVKIKQKQAASLF